MSAPSPSGFAVLRGRLFAWLQYVMPQHALSRLVLKATRVRRPWFKNALISGFMQLFDVDMQQLTGPLTLVAVSHDAIGPRQA